jgi:hypothetical protein
MNAPPTRVAEQQAEAIKRAGDIAAFLTAETLDALRELAADDSAWNDAAEDPAAALADRGITIPDDVDLVLYEHAWTGSPDSPDPAEDRDALSLRSVVPDVVLADVPVCKPGWRPVKQIERIERCTRAAKVTICVGGRLPSGECAATQTMVVCLAWGWGYEPHWICVPD